MKHSWKLLSKKIVFNHPHKKLVLWQMRTHQGKRHPFVMIEGRDVVIVFPFTTDGRVVVIIQYYVAVQRAVWTLPTGILDKGSTPAATARGELRQEAGCSAGRLISLGTALKGKYSTGVIRYFLALDVQPGAAQELEDAEDIAVKFFSLPQFERLLARGALEEAWVAVGAYRALSCLKKLGLSR